MLRSKSIGNVNSDSPDIVIELTEANPSNSRSPNKVNNIDFALDCKTEKNGRSLKNGEKLSSKEKDSEAEDYESNETTNLIYPYTTLRSSKLSPEALEEQAVSIANKMERKNKFMQDDPVSELLRIEMIRNMPQNLTLKRSVKAKLSLSVSQKSKKRPIGYWKKLKYRFSMSVSKLKTAFYNLGSSFELWQQSIKVIEGHFGSGIATYFKFLRWLFIMNTIGCAFSILFVTLPQALVQPYGDKTFSSRDLLLGNGFFTNSILYYGFYANSTLTIDSKISYDMPTAYFSTFLFCYLFTFVLLCFKVARTYRKCFIETSGGAYNRYANKIFCSWEWGISSEKAANLRSASIYRELQELLWETRSPSEPASWASRLLTLLIRLAMTSLIFSLICGTGGLLWLLLIERRNDESGLWPGLRVPLLMTCIVNCLPPLLAWSVKYERYAKDRIGFYVTMLRAYAIAVVAVATLLAYWLAEGMRTAGCWQTRLAQELYRLLVLDLLVSLPLGLLIQAVRYGLRRRFGPPGFDMARSSLGLVYNQSLFWLAHYFSPPLAVFVLLKLLVTFYVKKHELLGLCEPPHRYWRAAQTQTLFLALVFLAMLAALGILGYAFLHVDTSSCGPFAGKVYTWEAVAERVLSVRRDSAFWNVLADVVNPGTGIALLIAMCVAVYYLRAKAEASKQMVNILREMLVWQARDKEFLLKSFTSANKKTLWPRHRSSCKLTGTSETIDPTRDRAQVNEPSTSY